MGKPTIEEYSKTVDETWFVAASDIDDLVYSTLGVAGEAGEVADTVKKMLRGGWKYDENFRLDIAEELGDVLYYIVRVAKHLGYDLSDLMYLSTQKVTARKAKREENK